MDQKNAFSRILRTKHYPNQCIHSLYRANSTGRLKHSAKIVFIFSLRTAHNRLYVVDTTHIAISHAIIDYLRRKKNIVTFRCLLTTCIPILKQTNEKKTIFSRTNIIYCLFKPNDCYYYIFDCLLNHQP